MLFAPIKRIHDQTRIVHAHLSNHFSPSYYLTCCTNHIIQAEQGKIVIAGAYGDPPEGGLFIFKGVTEEVGVKP